MTISTVDAENRIRLSGVSPGEEFEVRHQGTGAILLLRLNESTPRSRLSREECLRALAASPVESTMTWEELRAVTRDP